MPHTDESWFTYFHADRGNPRGSKDRATVQTTTGAVIVELTPASPHYRPGAQTEQLREDFEDNVRLMGAARDMFGSLKQLIQAGIDAGMSSDSPVIRNALAAIDMAAPAKVEVRHEGEVKFRGTHNEAFAYIHQSQGQSYDYAIEHGGWSVDPVDPVPAPDDAAPAPRI